MLCQYVQMLQGSDPFLILILSLSLFRKIVVHYLVIVLGVLEAPNEPLACQHVLGDPVLVVGPHGAVVDVFDIEPLRPHLLRLFCLPADVDEDM